MYTIAWYSQPKNVVNLDKPLNSNRKPFFGSRFWIRSRTCQNGFFTLQFNSPSNQAFLSVLSIKTHTCTEKGLLSGSRPSLLLLPAVPVRSDKAAFFLHSHLRF